jgi:hypothetical protein
LETNIQASTPVTGVASPAPLRKYIPRALSPQRMWHVIRAVASLRNQVSPDEVARQIVPRGFPGAGVFHGNTNVAKSVTYRATYVPGGFNRERSVRRQEAMWKRMQLVVGDVNARGYV